MTMIRSLNPKENKPKLKLESSLQTALQQRGKIKEEMSPAEISEIVSDRVITVVREQFETARKIFLEKNRKK
jgi:hypothetical protein